MSRRLLLGIAAIAALVSCEQLKPKTGGSTGACVPEPVQAVLDARCATAGCHDATSAAQGLDLSAGATAWLTATATQSPMPMVTFGDVNASYLAQKMLQGGMITGTRMPVGVDFNDPAVARDLAILIGYIGGASFSGCAAGGGSSDGGGSTGGGDGNDGNTSSPTTGNDTNASDPTATSGDPSDGGTTDPTGTPSTRACGLAELAPDASDPIEAGDAAGMIPGAIGTILADNCGCHYADPPFDRMVLDYPSSGAYAIATLDQFLATGVIDKTLKRVNPANPALGMPTPNDCDVGGGEPMPPEDRATLISWLEAGAPDGASWP